MYSFIRDFTCLMVNHPWYQPGKVELQEKVLSCIFPHQCCTSVCCTCPGRILSGGLVRFSCKSVKYIAGISVSAGAVNSAGQAFLFLMAIHIPLDPHDPTVSFIMMSLSKSPHNTLPSYHFLYVLLLATQILEPHLTPPKALSYLCLVWPSSKHRLKRDVFVTRIHRHRVKYIM